MAAAWNKVKLALADAFTPERIDAMAAATIEARRRSSTCSYSLSKAWDKGSALYDWYESHGGSTVEDVVNPVAGATKKVLGLREPDLGAPAKAAGGACSTTAARPQPRPATRPAA